MSGASFDLGNTNVALALDCPFPANVNSGPGIEVDKSGGTWTLSLSYPPLVENLVPVPGNLYLAAYGTVSGLYQKVRADNLIAAATGLDTRQPIVDSNYNVTINDRYVALAMALTAPRILTLPPANSVPGGREVVFEDEVGGLSSVCPFTAQPTGTDTINGGASYVMATPYGGARFRSNGTNSWSVVNTSNFYLVPAGQTAYTASPDGNVIAWPAFSAPVVTTLPAAAAYPKGRRLTVADRNGSCTPTNTMAVHPAGSDTINGVAAPPIATMNAPYSTITLTSDGVSAWTVLGGGNLTAAASITSSQISDASTLGRQLITNATAALDRTALGSGAVGDQVFTSATQAAAQGAMGLGTIATQASNGVNITGGNIAGVAIATSTITNPTITGGTISGVSANGAVTLSPANANIAISPTGTGTVTMNPATAGHIDNTIIGATVPAACSVTSINGGQLAGQRNRIINGEPRIDQRNNGVAQGALVSAQYMVDRWEIGATQPGKFNSQQNWAGGIGTPPGFQYYHSMVAPAAYAVAAGDTFWVGQPVEGYNIEDLGWGTAAAKPVTLSFWACCGLTGTFSGAINNGGATRSYPFTFQLPTSNVWTYCTVTIPGDTTGTWPNGQNAGLFVKFNLGTGTTYSGPAGVWSGTYYNAAPGSVSVVGGSAAFSFTGVQLEMGTVATPFERRLMGTEMENCLRYYFQKSYLANALYTGSAAPGLSGLNDYIALPTPMRIPPTCGWGSTANWQYLNAGTVWVALPVAAVQSNDVSTVLLQFGASDAVGVTRLYRNTVGTFVSVSAEF